ncbi:hypothetical protein JOC78_002893 [Bacillus ectoiniformans]|uniref:hypothetical protein n=1 Tax=Bacillus ectoiniformans TaxID=1494429 RepID=UPI00195946A1|nr:hypothetical protein [Bacillus ectoiniformans]MBM7649909.1 hypothetical protein [Bacillus ectoiniformans]
MRARLWSYFIVAAACFLPSQALAEELLMPLNPNDTIANAVPAIVEAAKEIVKVEAPADKVETSPETGSEVTTPLAEIKVAEEAVKVTASSVQAEVSKESGVKVSTPIAEVEASNKALQVEVPDVKLKAEASPETGLEVTTPLAEVKGTEEAVKVTAPAVQSEISKESGVKVTTPIAEVETAGEAVKVSTPAVETGINKETQVNVKAPVAEVEPRSPQPADLPEIVPNVVTEPVVEGEKVNPPKEVISSIVAVEEAAANEVMPQLVMEPKQVNKNNKTEYSNFNSRNLVLFDFTDVKEKEKIQSAQPVPPINNSAEQTTIHSSEMVVPGNGFSGSNAQNTASGAGFGFQLVICAAFLMIQIALSHQQNNKLAFLMNQWKNAPPTPPPNTFFFSKVIS